MTRFRPPSAGPRRTIEKSPMNDNRNLILTIVLTGAILLGWQFLWPAKAPIRPLTPAVTTGDLPQAPGQPMISAPPENRLADLKATPRVSLGSKELTGSIALTGARIDDISLVRYRETTDPNSPDIVLLSPAAGIGAYYAEFGWVGAADSKLALPTGETRWLADSDKLTPDHPVTLTWDNGQGLRFLRKIAVDDGSMFTITDRVENHGASEVTLYPYGLLSRWGTPKTADMTTLYEGPQGALDGTMKEVKYKKLRDDEHMVTHHSVGGWLGFNDKYWLAALIPDQSQAIDGRFSWRLADNMDRYQSDWLGGAQSVPAGGSAEVTSRLFTGAKELAALDQYSDEYHIPLFDRAIDFGWFYWLAKPFFYLLRFIHTQIPNFGVAILVMTVVIRGAFFPIANRSYKSMNKMRALQPEMKKLQAKFADDKAKLQQEMMALYKREKVNPVSGCLPILLQIPVFFALYKVLLVTIEMRHAPFFGWIRDLSAPDPLTIFNLFGLIPWDPPGFLHIGIYALLMGGGLFVQQKLSPQPPDPVQAKMMTLMPLIFIFTMGSFPVGLVIYWAWSNLLAIAQQWVMLKRHAT
jgi:YidC/Oxa1 family membrane protein insertase